jgi:hypothetical protein
MDLQPSAFDAEGLYCSKYDVTGDGSIDHEEVRFCAAASGKTEMA